VKYEVPLEFRLHWVDWVDRKQKERVICCQTDRDTTADCEQTKKDSSTLLTVLVGMKTETRNAGTDT